MQKLINVRVDSKLKAQLIAEAKAIGLTLSPYIRMILIERNKKK